MGKISKKKTSFFWQIPERDIAIISKFQPELCEFAILPEIHSESPSRRWRGLPHSPSTVGAWSECQGALRVLLTFCKMPRWVFNSCAFWRYCNLGLQEEVSVGRNRKSNAKVCDGPNVSRNHLKLIRLVILSFLGVYVKS